MPHFPSVTRARYGPSMPITLGIVILAGLFLDVGTLALRWYGTIQPTKPKPIVWHVDIGDEESPSCWEDDTPPWMLKILYGPDEAPTCRQGNGETVSDQL